MPFDPTHAPVVFGEALFDCFPDGAEVLGGAPFNVAWHLAAFGAAPLFVSRVGDDGLGDRIERPWASRHDHRRPAAGFTHPTGTVQVKLTGGEPSYDIVAGRAYDFIDADGAAGPAGGSLLYHGTLALRNTESAAALERCEGHRRGLRRREPARSLVAAGEVRALLDGARWVKLNTHELAVLAPQSAGNGRRGPRRGADRAPWAGSALRHPRRRRRFRAVGGWQPGADTARGQHRSRRCGGRRRRLRVRADPGSAARLAACDHAGAGADLCSSHRRSARRNHPGSRLLRGPSATPGHSEGNPMMEREVPNAQIPALAAFLQEQRSQAHRVLYHIVSLQRPFLQLPPIRPRMWASSPAGAPTPRASARP
jgi:hypothetical protein